MPRFFLSVGFLLFTLGQLWAYPITPVTLRQLILNSPYIVVARIENPSITREVLKYDLKTKDTVTYTYFDFGGDGLADLHIQEVLKGNLSLPTIQVAYENYICPAPAHYPDKALVIAFLYKQNETDSVYHTCSLSYGSKIMETEADLALYKKRIQEFFAITALKNKQEKREATIEWLVACAEQKATCWEGAYDIERQSPMSLYYTQHHVWDELRVTLTLQQELRLKNVLLGSDTITDNTLILAGIFCKKYSPEIRKYLCTHYTTANNYLLEQTAWLVQQTAFNHKKLSVLFKKYVECTYPKEKADEARKYLQEFMAVANSIKG